MYESEVPDKQDRGDDRPGFWRLADYFPAAALLYDIRYENTDAVRRRTVAGTQKTAARIPPGNAQPFYFTFISQSQ